MGVNILAPYRIGYYLSFGAGKKHLGNDSSQQGKVISQRLTPLGCDRVVGIDPM